MELMSQLTLQKSMLTLINQLADLEQKIARIGEADALKRHIARMKDTLAEMNVRYEVPLGEGFSETRTDVEAHISGDSAENLEIVQVIKPIIRFEIAGTSRIIQKGVVVAQSRKEAARG